MKFSIATVALFSLLSTLTGTHAAPLASRAVAGPHNSIYISDFTETWPTVDEIKSYNEVNVAFWTIKDDGGAGAAESFEKLSADDRKKLLDEYHNAGKRVILSVFGAKNDPPADSDPVEIAGKVAKYTKDNSFDGVDIDYEFFAALNTDAGSKWLTPFHNELVKQLPSAHGYTISYAIAPWPDVQNGITPETSGLATLVKSIGDTVDYWNLMLYNGAPGWTTCENTFIEDTSINSGANIAMSVKSVKEKLGIPFEKMVIGKEKGSKAAWKNEDWAACIKKAKAEYGWPKDGGYFWWPEDSKKEGNNYPTSGYEFGDLMATV